MTKAMIRARVLVLLATLLVASGCTTRYIRQAQSEFSAGAAVELGNAANGAGLEMSPTPEGAARVHYRAAYELVVQEQAENGAELQRDKLLGTARMLEILAGWRLSDLDDDEELRVSVQNRVTDTIRATTSDPPAMTIGTRDMVLLRAMNGLLDHDRGLRQTTFAEVNGHFQSAHDRLGEALVEAAPPNDHPIRIWVRLAQLNTCKAWSSKVVEVQDRTADQRNKKLKDIHDLWVAAATHLKPLLAAYPQLRPVLELKAAQMGIDLRAEGIVADRAGVDAHVPSHVVYGPQSWYDLAIPAASR